MSIHVRRHDVEIRRELDAAVLDVLSAAAAEAAEEEGHLAGNQHYQDLRIACWGDVRYALEREAVLIHEFLMAQEPAAAERTFEEGRDLDGEREGLWNLDVGIAAPVMALGALGAHTVLSCNGGAFGNPHFRDAPCVSFYLADASLETLLALAGDADVGLVEEDHRGLLYARSILDLQQFARLAAERYAAGTRD